MSAALAQVHATSQPARGLERRPFGAPVDEVMSIIRRDGGIIFENVLTAEQVAQVNADLDAGLERLRFGSLKDDAILKDFHGDRTKRMTNVVTLSRTFREAFLSHETTLGYIRAIYEGVSDTFWLNTAQCIEIHPGEKAQMLHRDMSNYPVFHQYGPDGPEVMANMIVPLIDVTEEAGATRVIPGSHKWAFDRPYDHSMTVPATMKAGSALFYSGKLVHGGGANVTKNVRRRVVTCPYNPGFLVPEEAYPFTVPLEVAREMSPAMQQLIGFRSFHQRNPSGGSLWQHDYEELALYLGL